MLIARALEWLQSIQELARVGHRTERVAADSPREGRPTALVVDDSDEMRALLEEALVSRGFRVFAAPSVGSGLELLSRMTHVDLVVTDYSLGDGDGISMLNDARRRGWLAGTPAILCTGHTNLAAPSRVTLLHKPVPADVLLGVVDALVRPSHEASSGGANRCR
ncbi:MAG: response regulator [Myxococcales bacterium]|nr:response regulator [Myxococcales bacterium]